MTFGAGQFAATVAGSSDIGVSEDGVDWQIRATQLRIVLRGIRYLAGQFIAVGDDGRALISTNTIDWVDYPTATKRALDDVGYSNGTFVIVGHGVVLRSVDGRTWTEVRDVYSDFVRGITSGPNGFIAVADRGLSGAVLTSPNGKDWTRRDPSGAPTLFSVIYGRDRFVAVGMENNAAAIRVSLDGVAWQERRVILLPEPPGPLRAVTYSDEKGMFLATGNFTPVVNSSDGGTWRLLNPSNPGDTRSLAYGNGLFVVAGEGILFSSDGQNWSTGIPRSGLLYVNGVRFVDGVFWAVGFDGEGGGHGVVFRSTDGQSWTRVDLTDQPPLWAVGLATDHVMLAGDAGTLLSSGSLSNPPRFRSGEARFLQGGEFAATLEAAPGVPFFIESSSDLRTWSPVLSVTNALFRGEVIDTAPKPSGRFYRAVIR